MILGICYLNFEYNAFCSIRFFRYFCVASPIQIAISTSSSDLLFHLILIVCLETHFILTCAVVPRIFPSPVFYGLEACSLRKYQYKSINYVVNSIFRKIFNTKITRDC